MEIKATIDLDDVFAQYDETVAQLIVDELKAAIKKEVRSNLKDDPNLKKMIRLIQNDATKKVIASLTEVGE